MTLGAQSWKAAEGSLGEDMRIAAPSLLCMGKFCFGEPWGKGLPRNERELRGWGRQFLQLRVVSVQDRWLPLKASPDAERRGTRPPLPCAGLH